MLRTNTPRLSVSTWSLHRVLGLTYPNSPSNDVSPVATPTWGEGSVSLLEVPERVAAMGIHTLEICHFQLPSREASYLNELRGALDSAGVQLLSLLVDDGDITHPDHSARDLAGVGSWVETAGALGAERARVIAGKQDYSTENLQLSLTGLQGLAKRGQDCGVRVTTENWFPLLARPEHVLGLLDNLEGNVGLNLDFGNWGGPTKYDDLDAIFPRAESCHAKCAFPSLETPDAEDYGRCLALGKAHGFSGPYTLIYDGTDDNEWKGLQIESGLVRPYLQ